MATEVLESGEAEGCCAGPDTGAMELDEAERYRAVEATFAV